MSILTVFLRNNQKNPVRPGDDSYMSQDYCCISPSSLVAVESKGLGSNPGLIIFFLGIPVVSGLPRNYDAWRTMSDTDEQERREAEQRRREAQADRADYERDRQKDERAERSRTRGADRNV
jgi:hypothetical protein